MKLNKTALMLGIALIGAISFGWSSMDSQEPLSDLELANIEALTNGESNNVSNTGPAKETKCYQGGHRMVCLCVNQNPCTGTDCY